MIFQATPGGLFVRYKPGQSRVVLILGAGASSHLGFPLGRSLWTEIIQNTENRDSAAFRSLLDMGFDEQAVLGFRDRLKKFLPGTIDEFLAEWRDFRDIGKAAIAQVIIAREDEDKISQPDSNWYFLLAKRIRLDIGRNTFPPLIVTFNYDLSLDKCLLDFFRSTDRHKNIKTLDDAVTLLHVHGALGQLDVENGPLFRSYGNNLSPKGILEASQGIRVPGEIENDLGIAMVRAQKAIAEAERVIFLGFGYDETNLDNLRIEDWKHSKFYGTAFNLDRKSRDKLLALTNKKLVLGKSDWPIYEYLQTAPDCWTY